MSIAPPCDLSVSKQAQLCRPERSEGLRDCDCFEGLWVHGQQACDLLKAAGVLPGWSPKLDSQTCGSPMQSTWLREPERSEGLRNGDWFVSPSATALWCY